MTALWLISWGLWVPAFVLSITEWFPRTPLHCDCGTGWMAYRHLRPLWLFAIGALYVASDVVAIGGGKKFPVVAAVGAYYLWRWWRHTKNSRKKLKDKALGVVRETTAGLKVVPVGSES